MLSENKRQQKHKNTQLLRRRESGKNALTGKTRPEAANFLVFMSCFILHGITGESTHKRKHKKGERKRSLCLCWSLCLRRGRFHGEMRAVMLVLVFASLMKL